MKHIQLTGLIPATITPFAPDLSVAMQELEHHLLETSSAAGVTGLAVNGHIGEVLTLTTEERAAIVRLAVQVRRPEQIVIAGIEGRLPCEGIREAEAAANAGADALLILPPFDVRQYRKLNAHVATVVSYFRGLYEQVGLPMVVHQYPHHTGASYTLSVLDQLADVPGVIAIKAASGHTTHYASLWDQLHTKLKILPASDGPPLLGMLLHGGHGSLIGIGVVGPRHWAAMVDAALGGRAEEAHQIFQKICIPLMKSIFENQDGDSPISEAAATKEALVQLGQISSSRVRPPSLDVDDERRRCIQLALASTGLLDSVQV